MKFFQPREIGTTIVWFNNENSSAFNENISEYLNTRLLVRDEQILLPDTFVFSFIFPDRLVEHLEKKRHFTTHVRHVETFNAVILY